LIAKDLPDVVLSGCDADDVAGTFRASHALE
jgi:hypothetical protein